MTDIYKLILAWKNKGYISWSHGGGMISFVVRRSIMFSGGPLGGTALSFIADSQYSLEPIWNSPGSQAFHQYSICSGSTSFSGHVSTTSTSLSSVKASTICPNASLVRKSAKSSHRASLCLCWIVAIFLFLPHGWTVGQLMKLHVCFEHPNNNKIPIT